MKFLILTQYFPPEVGAPQNRLYDLAIRMKRMGYDVSVLTAMPNYPQMEIHENFRGKWFSSEIMDELKVYRSWIYVSKKKGVFFRLLNYFSFVFSSFFYALFKINEQDFILVESPPLFLGKTAWLLSKIKRSKLIFNVSDLWPESAERLGIVKNRFFLRMAYWLEAFLYKRSWLITGQTQGIVKDIQNRFPGKRCYWLPNGVDLNFFKTEVYLNSIWREKHGFTSTHFILLYAGIIGHAQGLEVILKAAERLRENSNIKFVLLGSGPEKEKLVSLKEELNLENVFFLPTVTKNEMPSVVASCDAAVIPLRKLEIFKGAIPSKIFENLGMRKPIILGVEGEAKELFIDEAQAGIFFEPENDESLSFAVQELIAYPEKLKQMGDNGYAYVAEKFERNRIAENFNFYLMDLMK